VLNIMVVGSVSSGARRVEVRLAAGKGGLLETPQVTAPGRVGSTETLTPPGPAKGAGFEPTEGWDALLIVPLMML
jgi:hypothetical protein